MLKFLTKVSQEYFDHMKLLLKVFGKDHHALAEWVNQQCKSDGDEYDTEIASQFSLTADQIVDVFKVSIFTAKHTECEETKLKSLLSKLREKEEDEKGEKFETLLNEKIEKDLLSFFSEIKEGVRIRKQKELDLIAFHRGTPILKGFSISPILKFRRDKDIPSEEIDIDSYNPKPRAVEAYCVEIKIRTVAGDEGLSFQFTEKNLEEIKKMIRVAEVEMAALKRLKERTP